MFPVNVISSPDNTTSLEFIKSQLENPLIDSDHQDLHDIKQLPIPNVHHHRVHYKQKNQSQDDREGKHFLRILHLISKIVKHTNYNPTVWGERVYYYGFCRG